MNNEIFREYDIRGLAKEDLPDAVVELIGKAYGTIIHNNGGSVVVIGMDNRKSSPRIRAALVKGITATGVNVTLIGETPTPLLYYAVNKLNADGGINVTASHNPPEFNGFKVLVGKEAIYGEKIQEIFRVAEKGDFSHGNGEVTEKSLDEQYLNDIVELVKIGTKPRVVLDAGNGMASELAPRLLEKLGLAPVCLYCEKDGSFPNHPPDPVEEENVRDLAKKIREEKADFGIAFDGDADRLGVLDENGALIYGDKLLGILAAELLSRKPGEKVIYEVKCSKSLEEYILAKGGKPVIWKTGHSLIKAKLKEENALLAGEMSGHMYFAENWFGVDDALLAAAKVIEAVSKSGKKVSEMVSEMPHYFSSPEYRVDCADSKKSAVVKTMVDKYKKIFPDSVTLDGIRIIYPDAWALVRQSNTQPKIILRFEAKTEDRLEKIREEITKEVQSLIEKTK